MPKKQTAVARKSGIVGNASYLLLAQVAAMLSPAVTAILVARKMDVAEFAAFSYALALIAVATSVMTAGLAGLAIREITSGLSIGRAEASGTLKSIVALRELFSCIGVAVILLFAYLGQSDISVVTLTAVLSFSLFFRAADAIEFWQQAQEKVSYFVLLRVSVIMLSTGIRAVLILNGTSLTVVVASMVIESAVLSGASWVYNRNSSIPVNISSRRGQSALQLLKMSWVLLLSGLLAQLSMRLGVIYLGNFSDATEVAQFAAASRLTEFAFVLPVVVTTASFPRLLRTRSEHGRDSIQYKSEVQRSLNYAFWTGLFFSVCAVVAGPFIIPLLFGDAYNSSISILQLTALVLPFVFMGAVLSKWIIAEDLLLFSLWRNVLGLIMNIVLLAILVPSLGALGAAIAYLTAFITTNYLSFFWSAKSRAMAYAMTRTIYVPIVYSSEFLNQRLTTRKWSRE